MLLSPEGGLEVLASKEIGLGGTEAVGARGGGGGGFRAVADTLLLQLFGVSCWLGLA